MTTPSHAVLEALDATGLVAVVRAESTNGLIESIASLERGGISLFEITLTVPGALKLIADLKRSCKPDTFIGAGTVLDAKSAKRAVAAGADFIVSPAVSHDTIEFCHRSNVLAVPGCLTPTEIAAVLRAGAELIKLFPGRVATPGYLRDVLGPFPSARFLPTGNVDLASTEAYIAAGAAGVGVGKALFAARGEAELVANAAAFRQAVARSRASQK